MSIEKVKTVLAEKPAISIRELSRKSQVGETKIRAFRDDGLITIKAPPKHNWMQSAPLVKKPRRKQ